MLVVMTYVISVLLFLAVFRVLSIWPDASSSFELIHHIIRIMSDTGIDDYRKELAVRQGALKMVKISLLLLVKVFLLMSALWVPVWLSDWAGWSTFSQTTHFALRLDVILLTVIMTYLVALLLRKVEFKQHSRHS